MNIYLICRFYFIIISLLQNALIQKVFKKSNTNSNFIFEAKSKN